MLPHVRPLSPSFRLHLPTFFLPTPSSSSSSSCSPKYHFPSRTACEHRLYPCRKEGKSTLKTEHHVRISNGSFPASRNKVPAWACPPFNRLSLQPSSASGVGNSCFRPLSSSLFLFPLYRFIVAATGPGTGPGPGPGTTRRRPSTSGAFFTHAPAWVKSRQWKHASPYAHFHQRFVPFSILRPLDLGDSIPTKGSGHGHSPRIR